jgi:hypothetical protein
LLYPAELRGRGRRPPYTNGWHQAPISPRSGAFSINLRTGRHQGASALAAGPASAVVSDFGDHMLQMLNNPQLSPANSDQDRAGHCTCAMEGLLITIVGR